MSERPTPETDDAQWGTGKVTTDFARRLERERDELRVARNECERQFQEKIAENIALLDERDETREALRRAKRFVEAFEPRSLGAEVDQNETLNIIRKTLEEIK